jgi:hypothetical protein
MSEARYCRVTIVAALAGLLSVSFLDQAMAGSHCDIPQRLVWDCRYGITPCTSVTQPVTKRIGLTVYHFTWRHCANQRYWPRD